MGELGLTNHTLLVFCSDNGPQHKDSSTGPLRGQKGQTLEEGVRVPCLMSWPGRIPAGTVCHGVASVMDIFPTFASVIGEPLHGDRIMDGRNLWPMMMDPESEFPYQAL